MDLSEKILALRKARGITQDELAQALYITRQSVYKWETGHSVPDIEKIKQLCKLFNISADELLDMQKLNDAAFTSFNSKAYKLDRKAQDVQKHKLYKIKYILLAFVFLFIVFSVIFFVFRPPAEIRQAISLGIVPSNIQHQLSKTISVKDFLCMLQNASQLKTGKENPLLCAAVNTAGNEQILREKAAYWLYCTHIWTLIDPTADLSIGTHALADPIAVRNVYEDLNSISKLSVDCTANWESALCYELAETCKLFDSYDG